MKVLYLHPFSVFGGATKSLSEMISALPDDSVVGVALCPKGGAFETFRAVGIEVLEVLGITQWDDTRYGYYRGFRWLILLREFSYLPSVFLGLWRARKLGPYSLIHCNEITAILVGVLAKKWLGAPLLVHVRSLQRQGHGRISKWLMKILRLHADKVVAIDEAVRRTLPADIDVTVIHNGLKIPVLPKEEKQNSVFCVGIVGVLGKLKGVYEFVEAGRILRDRNFPIRMLIVGENARDLSGISGWLLKKLDFAHDVKADLESYIQQYDLSSSVEFTGFIPDVSKVYAKMDALCFPSHLDAPGRPVFEAALHGLPSIVAMKNPTGDVVVDGETGVCIDSPDPLAIANAIESMASDRQKTKSMGTKARENAVNKFDSEVGALKILRAYRELVGRNCGGK